MTSAQFEREKNYQASLTITKSMLHQGLIDQNDFDNIKGFLIERFRPVIGCL